MGVHIVDVLAIKSTVVLGWVNIKKTVALLTYTDTL